MSDSKVDFLIIGSGFGGSISAMRLAQKGYSVQVLEMGKEWRNQDFPKSNWNIFRYLWAPVIRCFGIQKITWLKKVMVLHGAGVGGGSLVWANTLMRPKDEIFKSELWPKSIDWPKDLAPHFDRVKNILGGRPIPQMQEAEVALKKLCQEMNREESFHLTDVAVYFGEEGKTVDDPYFSGEGPSRTGCLSCGACMIGCPHGAKNTLDKNYLYFARKWGAEIFAETKADKIIPLADGSYQVETISSTAWFPKRQRKIFNAKNIIFAAGALGTVELLLKNKEIYKTLPHISDQLGQSVRTNGEALLGVTSFNKEINYSKGVAIGAAFHADEVTKIETVRYPSGSGLLRFLGVPLTPHHAYIPRSLLMIFKLITTLPRWIRLWLIRDWARSTLVLLVMQSIESKMKLRIKKRPWGDVLTGELGSDDQLLSYLPIAQEAGEKLGSLINGAPQNMINEVALSTPATAHILGGAILSDSSEKGVVDPQHQIHGHPGLYITDGSVIPSNLAVNPSLTISALTERFCTQFPLTSKAIMTQSDLLKL